MKRQTALKIASAPIALSIGLATGPALAQDVSVADDTDAETQSEQTIVVTGSRIQRDPNSSAPSPITSVSITDALESGTTDITEALREIPALSGSGTVNDSIQRGAGGTGQATLNLRGLGSGRTLVTVNGLRHVSGVAESQIVDVSTIPSGLIERVEILTGGASAVYGADAVTGVVNYVLKEDFTGFDASIQGGISEEGDGFTGSIDLVWGTDWADGRGNLTLAYGYDRSSEIKNSARPYARDNNLVNTGLEYTNVDRIFQDGDISASSTPNFANYYSIANGRYPYGLSIPLPGSSTYDAIFSGGTTPTAAEQALIDQAQNAPSNSFLPRPNFSISSNSALIGRADFGYFLYDANSNGVQDCEESFVGFYFGTCYVSDTGGGVSVFQDGLVAGFINQFGGDGAYQDTNFDSLIPEKNQHYGVVQASFDFSPALEWFFDGKYVTSESRRQSAYALFHDPVYIYPENPYIPAVLQADADDAGGLYFARDYTDLGPGNIRVERETYRIVSGFRGDIWDELGLSYEAFVNWGRTDSDIYNDSAVLADRLWAALDAVDEGEFNGGPANGNIVCRSELDPTAVPPGSDFFPYIQAGFFTFTPGQGACSPFNVFNGQFSASQEAIDFITVETLDQSSIEQFNAGVSFVGDTSDFFSMPGGGPIGFALGGEYRDESAQTLNNTYARGIFPVDTPAGPAGTYIGDVSDNGNLLANGGGRTLDSGGSYDVWEAYGEIRIPIIEAQPWTDLLEVSAQGRVSDYSNIGTTFTWGVNGIWAPIEDIRLRGTFSRAVRAPDISELFSPQQPQGFRPNDPCDSNNIAARDPGDPFTANVIANCAAEGIPSTYTDPLTARFIGAVGGNPNLTEETADTYTFGAVLRPRFLPGLVISGDYYNIKIEDGIGSVSAQNIVDNCYEATSLDNQYCDLIERDPTTFGFTYLLQSQLNFGRLETAGIDGMVGYNFDIGENEFGVRVVGNWTDYIDQFFDPADPTAVDPGLQELGFPEFSGTASLTYSRGPFSIRYGVQYLGEMTIGGVEIEDAETVAGEFAFHDETFIHDVTVTYDLGNATIFGGVNNLTGEDPFRELLSYPVSPYGRYFFLGVRFSSDQIPFFTR